MLLHSYRAAAVRPLRAMATRQTAVAPTVRPLVSILRVPRPERPSLLLARAGNDDGGADDDDVDNGDSPFSSSTPTPSSSSSDDFTPADAETAWLTQFLPFSRLSLDAATWLAANAERETLSPGQKIIEPGGPPSLVAVRSGRVGVARAPEGGALASSTSSSSSEDDAPSSPSSSPSPPPSYTAAGPGASFGAADLLAGRPSRSDVIALGEGAGGEGASKDSGSSPFPASSLETATTVLRITPSILASLAEKFPGAERALLSGAVDAGEEAAALAAADAAALRRELEDAARRAAALQPFLVTSPKRGIVGGSRYASRLRKEILAASRDPARGPVFVFGEPGLGKDNVAALVSCLLFSLVVLTVVSLSPNNFLPHLTFSLSLTFPTL